MGHPARAGTNVMLCQSFKSLLQLRHGCQKQLDTHTTKSSCMVGLASSDGIVGTKSHVHCSYRPRQPHLELSSDATSAPASRPRRSGHSRSRLGPRVLLGFLPRHPRVEGLGGGR